MKFTFLGNVGSDMDAFHNVDFSLSGTPISTSSHQHPISCKTCLAPLQILSNIGDSIQDKRPDIDTAISDVNHTFLLYIGHQHRCLSQEKRIAVEGQKGGKKANKKPKCIAAQLIKRLKKGQKL